MPHVSRRRFLPAFVFSAAFAVLGIPSSYASTAPIVTSIARLQPGPLTTSDAVTWRVTFNESVTGVDATDFGLTTVSGSAGGVVSAVSGAGVEYTVTASSLTGVGTLRLDLKASGTGILDAENLAVGGGFTFGQPYTHIRSSTPVAWGLNFAGQLGNTSTALSKVPVSVTTSGVLSGKTVVASATGGKHSLALTSDGRVYAWGDNGWGQLGDGATTANRTLPVPVFTSGVLSGKTVIAIAAGYTHSVALTSDGKVYTWGYNGYGELGTGTANWVANSAPVAVAMDGALSGKTVVAVLATGNCTFSITSDGQLYAWGSTELGQSDGPIVAAPTAVTTSGVLSGKAVVAVAGGYEHWLALTSEGRIYAWGRNRDGQLGIGSTDSDRHKTPQEVPASGVLSGRSVVAIAAGQAHSLVLTSDGRIATWGLNRYGELGVDAVGRYPVPLEISAGGALSGETVVAIAAGLSFSQVLTSEGRCYMWGYNDSGQLGNTTTTNRSTPGLVATASGTGSALAGCMVLTLSPASGETSHVTTLASPLAVGSVSVPTAGAYQAGETLGFTVKFAQAVTVSTTGGTPRIALIIGSTTRYAVYVSGTGTTALTFNYTAQAGDTDGDGIVVSSASIDLSGGGLTDLQGNAVDLTLPPLGTSGIKLGGVAPQIVTAPADATAQSGAAASFSVVATGTPSPTFQWQVSTDSGGTWSNVSDSSPYSGATTNSLSITAATTELNGYRYRCLASNSVQSNVASGAGTLTVRTPLAVWRQQHFGTMADAGDAANDADPDLDGRGNLLEYALGTLPNAADSSAPMVEGSATDGDGTHATLTFNRIADPALVYTVEASDDLITWAPIWTSTGAQNVAGSVVATDSEVRENHERRFLRLRVSN